MISTRKPSICFVSPNNYAVLSGRSDLGHIGGSEIQQPMIARELLERGYRASFITLDHGQPDGIEHDGIRVYKTCSRSDGIPGLRFIHPRWTSLWRAMARADADIYYQRNAGSETGQIAWWCARHRRRFIFAVASDLDCLPGLPYLRKARERILYRAGLHRADCVIAQTLKQQQMLESTFRVRSVLIRSCSADPRTGGRSDRAIDPDAPLRLLWVGRFAVEKRIEFLFDLAQRCPEYQIDVVGGAPPKDEYARKCARRASELPNIRLHGIVPHAEIGAFYDCAALLLCTSPAEGYPNTFMEAWARGVPVVTTVDPDEVVRCHGLGALAADVDGLIAEVHRLTGDPDLWATVSRTVREFYLETHTIDATCSAYESLFETLTNGACRPTVTTGNGCDRQRR